LIRVAIVDDHPIALRGVASALADAGDIVVTASVAHPADLPTVRDAADVVILDLYHDGAEPCIAAVATLASSIAILVMSASGRPADVMGAIRAGARGYITKQAPPELFATATRTVAGGGFWLSSQLADIMQSQLGVAGSAPAPARLSPREEEALDLIARGYTHAQTATRMGVSKATVDTYVERIRTKLQVGNKADLTRAALGRLHG
jgi:two-component system, NarL family, nitrate/nitrite response regulator NarL